MNAKKAKIICTTVLVERSPQALPLGAACVASAIKNSPLTKDFCEVLLECFYPSDSEAVIAESLLEEFFKDDDKSLVRVCAFSVFVWNRLVLEKVAAALREKGVICIAGGPEITARLRDNGNRLDGGARLDEVECADNGDRPAWDSSFDYVVSDEGEISVPRLIKEIVEKKGHTSSSLLSLEHGGQSSSPQLSEDSYPSPYLDGTINPDDFGGVLWELARGCPFKCSYCYESKG